MDTLLVRLKPFDPHRRHLLRRYTYAGIRFQVERGWYHVERPVADYLRQVRQVAGDPHAPPAFDVCTEEEAKAIDAAEEKAATARTAAKEAIPLTRARGAGGLTTADLPENQPAEPPPKPPAPAEDPPHARAKPARR